MMQDDEKPSPAGDQSLLDDADSVASTSSTSDHVHTSLDTTTADISSIVNPLNSTLDDDVPAIALLKQIFPEESPEALRELHHHRIHQKLAQRPASKLGQRIWNSLLQQQSSTTATQPQSDHNPTTTEWTPVELPSEFLRLPTTIAVRRTLGGTTRYEFVADLHNRVLQEYLLVQSSRKRMEFQVLESKATTTLVALVPPEEQQQSQQFLFYTVVIHRHATLGLGLTLTMSDEDDILVHGLVSHPENPSAKLDCIVPGDTLIGINGSTCYFLNHVDDAAVGVTSTMQQVVQAIQNSADPIVLHLGRKLPAVTVTPASPTLVERNCSLLDSTFYPEEDDDEYPEAPRTREGPVHRRLFFQNDTDLESIATASTITTTTTHSSTTPYNGQLESRQPYQHLRQAPMVIHPFAKALAKRGLIRGHQDEVQITRHLHQFTMRTWQWESQQALRLDATTRHLLFSAPHQEWFCPPSTPLAVTAAIHMQDISLEDVEQSVSRGTAAAAPFFRSYFPGESRGRHEQRRQVWQSPSMYHNDDNETARRSSTNPSWNELLVPLYNVRQALCARIVHSFVDRDQRAFSIWVYDVETTKEWYAPIRYQQDFQDLHQACLEIAPKSMGLHEWEFPSATNTNNKKLGWWSYTNPVRSSSSFSTTTTNKTSSQHQDFGGDSHCHQLEHFLRKLCSLVYTCVPIVPEIAELAIHVQSFLGVEAGLSEQSTNLSYDGGTTDNRENMSRLGCPVVESPLVQRRTTGGNGVANVYHDDDSKSYQDSTHEQTEPLSTIRTTTLRHDLKQSLQRYTYRVFLLNVMTAIVQDFVDTTRRQGPKLEDIESLQVQATLQSRARHDLERLQAFLDQLVDLILEGCADDLMQIARHDYYASCHEAVLADETAWGRLVREAVREQVEIEVYVPLRSVVSRLLVNGWRHEDMQVQFKLKELRRRAQGAFRIPSTKRSPSHWQSVATILKKGVGMSTLPCVKLRAIVDSAREITRLYEQEHPLSTHQTLGADDFLPIFIFCVVRADMERPCALCLLLQTLCDRMNRIGEIGYFLASFEAAISHITELDLTEADDGDDDDAVSFLTGPLTEVSLNEE